MAGKMIMLQPVEFVSAVVGGHEMTELPKPYYVHTDGSVARQDYWKGEPAQVVGFVEDPDVYDVTLLWQEAVKDPQRAVGMYVVTLGSDGVMGTVEQAIDHVRVLNVAAKK